MTKTKRTTTRKPKAKSNAPAKAKAEKAATAKPAADSRPGAGKPTRDGDKKIKLITRENPYRGKRGAGYALLKDGMTVEVYYAAGHAAGFASSLLRSVLLVGSEGKHLALNGGKK